MTKPYSIRLIELRYKRPFVALCREWRAQGMSWRAIGERVGVSHTLAFRHGREADRAERELTVA